MRVGDEGVEVGEGGGMANADIEVARKAGERREGRKTAGCEISKVAIE